MKTPEEHAAQFVKSIEAQKPMNPEAFAAYEFKHNVQPLLHGAGWEERFHFAVPMTGKQLRAMERMNGYLLNCGAIVALVGPRGLGKTTLAAFIAIARAKHFWTFYSRTPDERGNMDQPRETPLYRKAARMVERFKGIYADFGTIDAESASNAKEYLCNCDLLVIDELNECGEVKIKDRILTDICDIRYARMKDTILISNQTAEDFKATVNDSILSRLGQHGGIVNCNWPSFRVKGAV